MLKNSLSHISPQIKASYELLSQKYLTQSFYEAIEEAQKCLDLLEDSSQIMNPEESISPAILVTCRLFS